MKLMLALASDESLSIISQNIKPLGFDLIRYRHILKAMDNIDEVDPDGIIISAQDFPRHWKILVQFVRSERPKEICPIILLNGATFSQEEAVKAFYLGVSGIIAENMRHCSEVDRLQSILERYIRLEDKRRSRRYHVEDWPGIGFCMINPLNKVLLTAAVKTISSSGISFTLDHAELAENILVEEEIAECSLRAGNDILSPICQVIRKEPVMSMEFIFLSGPEQIMLEDFLENIPCQAAKEKQA
ncbi:MAG: PilZ domain-containing protein [Treponema sp.]|jgi:hypothetical protein|nr:PilZ domain-containing protein [Treponema sp.]